MGQVTTLMMEVGTANTADASTRAVTAMMMAAPTIAVATAP